MFHGAALDECRTVLAPTGMVRAFNVKAMATLRPAHSDMRANNNTKHHEPRRLLSHHSRVEHVHIHGHLPSVPARLPDTEHMPRLPSTDPGPASTAGLYFMPDSTICLVAHNTVGVGDPSGRLTPTCSPRSRPAWMGGGGTLCAPDRPPATTFARGLHTLRHAGRARVQHRACAGGPC